jgi:type IV secretory pathway TrbF-like protein
MNLPRKIYTETEVTRAKNTAQVVGWAQGAGAVVVAAVAWRLLGWIPVVLVLGAVAWVLYRLLVGGKDTDGD